MISISTGVLFLLGGISFCFVLVFSLSCKRALTSLLSFCVLVRFGFILYFALLQCLEFFCFNLIHYVFCFLNILRNVPVHGTGSPEERRTGSYILHHPGRQAGCPTVEVTPGPSKGVELPWAHRARLQGGISGSPY